MTGRFRGPEVFTVLVPVMLIVLTAWADAWSMFLVSLAALVLVILYFMRYKAMHPRG